MPQKLNKQQGERLISLLPLLISLISGVFMGLTVAPFNAWFLAWIALIPLWVLVVSTKRKKQSLTLRQAKA
ncbi:apolipoprotein N-acyltransferase, partial [Nostoc sp. NIES-2111]